MKVMVTGGGTGGHIYPALATASALRALDPGIRLLYGGRPEGLEHRLAFEQAIEFCPLPGRPLAPGAGMVKAAFSLAKGLARAKALIAEHNPDVVLGTGGYVSTALGMAQAIRKKPLVLVEGNSIPGKTNKLLARRAAVVCTAFEMTARHLPKGRCVLTGYPIRPELTVKRDRDEGREAFSLSKDSFVLLVVGGSQGARAINDAVRFCAPALIEQGIQILHQLGPKNAADYREDVPGWIRRDYIEDMPLAYAAADLVIARAGCSTFSELAVQGVPAILVPYPYSAEGHQLMNARELSDAGRAVLLEQEDMTPDTLVSMVTGLKDDEKSRNDMSRLILEWGKPDAAKRVAEITLAAANGQVSFS